MEDDKPVVYAGIVGPTKVKLPLVEMQLEEPGYECAGLQAYPVVEAVR